MQSPTNRNFELKTTCYFDLINDAVQLTDEELEMLSNQQIVSDSL
jgi:hypothetical protein